MIKRKKALSLLLALCMVLSMVCTTALAEAVEGEETEVETVACTKTEDCTAKTHEEGCPKYVAPVEDENKDENKDENEPENEPEPENKDENEPENEPEPEVEEVPLQVQKVLKSQRAGLQDDDEDETTIITEEDLSKALENTTVTKIVLGEITLSSPVEINRDLTLANGTINGTITVKAGVTLTLENVTITATAGPGIAVNGTGVTLEVKGENSVTSIQPESGPVGFAGVEVPMETSLTITGDGTLNATAGGGAGVGGSCGASEKWLNGDIVVNMTGTLNATGAQARPDQGAYGGAGIGAASYFSPDSIKDTVPGNITIEKGTIIASGGYACAGIGGGSHTQTGTITVNGGNITAVGGSDGGAGIGSGVGSYDHPGKFKTNIVINGGTIDTTGKWLAAGIGGGYECAAEIKITSGNITAKSTGSTKNYQGAPGIGGGYQGNAKIEISGANTVIDATGDNSAPGIGNGPVNNKPLNKEEGTVQKYQPFSIEETFVNISGGNITALGGCNASGIGGGNATLGVNVEITGGTVNAKGGDGMPDIGSGAKNDAEKPEEKYVCTTAATVTIGPGATLVGGTTIGAPEGNRPYRCYAEDGNLVYSTVQNTDTVAVWISAEQVVEYSDLAEAVGDAAEGDTVQLVANATLERGDEIKDKDGKVIGYQPSLVINKAITLDLNGKTIYAGSTIQTDGAGLKVTSTAAEKGTISYGADLGSIISSNGAVLAELSNLVLDGNNTASVGISMPGSWRTIALIKDSEIKNVASGITLYKVRTGMIDAIGNVAPAIQKMENVTIEAANLGMEIYMSECAMIENCTITGGKALVVKGNNGDGGYPTSAKIVGGTLTGTDGPAIEISDANWWAGNAQELTIKSEINGTTLSGKDGVLMESVEREQTVGAVKFETTAVNSNAVCYLTEGMGAAEGGKKIFYATYAKALARGKTITVLETTADPGSYMMSEGETITAIGSDIRTNLTAPAGYVVKVTEDPAGTFTYTLGVAVASVTLTPATASLYTGNTVSLTATVLPDNADDKTVTWSSSNTAVATVDTNGVVRGVTAGTAVITATVGGKTATCTVTVSTYTAPTGGGTVYYPGTTTPTPPTTNIEEENPPLANVDGLNTTDHFAYIAGYPDGTVKPEASITRAEAATIFYRLMTDEFRVANWAEENSFTDVKAGDWHNVAISVSAKAGILKGYPDGTFKPNEPVTRAEFATMAARFMTENITGENVGYFEDTKDHWAAEDIRKAVEAGWIKGETGGKFNPDQPITRAEVMTLVNYMLDRVPDADHMLSDMKVWPDNPAGTEYYSAVQEATNSHDYEVKDNVETWTKLTSVDWAAKEAEWIANNGASAKTDEK